MFVPFACSNFEMKNVIAQKNWSQSNENFLRTRFSRVYFKRVECMQKTLHFFWQAAYAWDFVFSHSSKSFLRAQQHRNYLQDFQNRLESRAVEMEEKCLFLSSVSFSHFLPSHRAVILRRSKSAIKGFFYFALSQRTTFFKSALFFSVLRQSLLNFNSKTMNQAQLF